MGCLKKVLCFGGDHNDRFGRRSSNQNRQISFRFFKRRKSIRGQIMELERRRQVKPKRTYGKKTARTVAPAIFVDNDTPDEAPREIGTPPPPPTRSAPRVGQLQAHASSERNSIATIDVLAPRSFSINNLLSDLSEDAPSNAATKKNSSSKTSTKIASSQSSRSSRKALSEIQNDAASVRSSHSKENDDEDPLVDALTSLNLNVPEAGRKSPLPKTQIQCLSTASEDHIHNVRVSTRILETIPGLDAEAPDRTKIDTTHLTPQSPSQDATATSVAIPSSTLAQLPTWLQPIAEAKPDVTFSDWNGILGGSVNSIRKIAEASYAEVYLFSNEIGTSVFKIIPLKPESGRGSKRANAMPVESVISELQIMDKMAEVPGYLMLKGAHVIRGRPTGDMCEAWATFRKANKGKEMYFPNPRNYHQETVFLALELDNAGKDLENIEIIETGQVWDIFLGTVIALSLGERHCSFEHRDLHEGNICVQPAKSETKGWSQANGWNERELWHCDQRYKLRKAGYEVTLLDYTLSRANIGDDKVAFLDLEKDLELFKASGISQYDIYRRMRTWVFKQSKSSTGPDFHDTRFTESNYSWSDYNPYTNVLWLWFLMGWLQDRLEHALSKKKAQRKDVVKFRADIKQLMTHLSPEDTAHEDFESATHIAEFALENGWIRPADMYMDYEGNSTLE